MIYNNFIKLFKNLLYVLIMFLKLIKKINYLFSKQIQEHPGQFHLFQKPLVNQSQN